VEAVRPATPADAERCSALCRQALDEVYVARGGSLFVRREAGLVAKALLRPGGLSRLLADGRRRVLLGTVDDVVVAMAVGHVDAVGEAVVGVVDGCYVEPGARRAGLGRALLDALVGSLAASGCRGVDVAALPGDRATKSLLESAGFKARLLTMYRSLA
jgi:ribosomal protein S18 acetylase RimI-like enzyme